MDSRFCIIGTKKEKITNENVHYIFDIFGNLITDENIENMENYFQNKKYAMIKLKNFITTYNNMMNFGSGGGYIPDIMKLNIENGKYTGMVDHLDVNTPYENPMRLSVVEIGHKDIIII